MADDIIGSVAVEVLPNAKRFVQDFKAKVLPGARQAGDEIGNVAGAAAAKRLGDRLKAGIDEGFRRSDPARQGGKQGEEFGGAFARALKARLEAARKSLPKFELDANSTPAQRKIAELRASMDALRDRKIGVDITARDALLQVEKIKAELKLLTGKRQDISVRFDAHAALAEVEQLTQAVQGIGAKSAEGSAGAPGGPALIGGAIAAGLALVGPASGAAVAGLGAVAGAGGTALLAIKGIEQEAKDGTVAGRQFDDQWQRVKRTVTGLEAVAAKGAGGGFLAGLKELNDYAPELAPVVASISRDLGQAGATTAHALVAGLRVATPLLEDGGRYAELFAQKLDNAAQSPRFRQFIDYARQELPVVGKDLADLAKFGVDAAVAFQPLGDELLKDLDGLVKIADGVTKVAGVIDRIPHAPAAIVGAVNPLIGLTGLLGNSGGKQQASQTTQALAALQASLADLTGPTQTETQRLEELSLQWSANASGASAFATADQAANQAIDQQAISLAATTRQMYLQSDAGGLLKQQLDALSGKQLDAAQAQNQFEQGLVSMVQTIKGGHPTLVGLSSDAIQNRSSLLNLVQSAEASAEAYGSLDKSGEKTRQKLVDLRQQIIDNAVAHGENRAQVTAYIDSVLKIPAKVTTKVDVETAAAKAKADVLQNTLGHLVGPVLTVKMKGVDGAILAIRSVVEYAANHPAVIHVATTNLKTGATSGGRQVLEGKADGGVIRGSGGPRQDNILIAASVGERVVPNGPSQRFAPLLDAIIAGRGLPRFADGGLVSIDTSPAKAKAAASKTAAATKAAASLATGQANIRFTASLDLSRLNSAGTASAIAAVIRKLITDVHTAAAKGVGSNSLIPTLQAENSQLGRLANERVALTNKIKTATASLNAQRQASAQEAGQVAGSISGAFDITSLDGPARFGTASPAAAIRNFELEAQQIDNANEQIKKLRALGLDKNLVQQLGEKGAAAFPAIQSLSTASATQVAQIDALYARVQASSKATGSQVAGSLFQAGIDSATGYIRGLDSQLAKVNAAASRLAQTVVKQIKRDLGIHSPSRVMRQHGRYTGEGFALGIADRYGMVTRSATGLANAAVQPAQFGGGGRASVRDIHQHNHWPAGPDPQAQAEDAARRMVRRVRT